MKRKLMSIILTVFIFTTLFYQSVYASNTQDLMDLSDIPVFIAKVVDSDDASKEVINSLIEEKLSNTSYISNEKTTLLDMQNGDIKINELTLQEKSELASNDMFANTLNRVQELINSGTTVNYLTFYLTSDKNMTATSSNPNDPAYWEANCPSFGTYNGYKFLYLESSVNVETTWVNAGNLSPSINWSKIPSAVIKAYVDYKVKGALSSVVAYTGTLSDFFGVIQNPLQISYGASGTYLKYKVSGDIYMRDILIRDDNNRVNGYAYYSWGFAERLSARLKCDGKWAVGTNPGGTYIYFTSVGNGSYFNQSTPGYYGGTAILSSIVNLYQNNSGYFTHSENIDVNATIVNMFP